ncbi:heavy-metal-associated domain-containing protein [Prevotella sp.]|uniref:heavy-metal-associated domain-containing protein n=1 Tax=Prevotella sp. TaxID=59823 RepID=UPI002F928160
MKRVIFTMVALAAMSVSVEAKTVKTVFPVSGSCEMCKARIEKVAAGQSGVVSAKWNMKTKKMALVYDAKKTDVKKVQKAIVAAGHDAGSMKAAAQTYNKLPQCCKYRK